ncbi:YqjD family protein [Algimonas porphyrae]|uniref:DUF883 domain-containing protein n=1 Tax=Algimonas porphyrae TaxID=1128113 RepID=A0ABQ5V0T4_9PROT|nr:hypothetical protein [Algimonas porphyrae]GLQ21169.1 hypothetical protein GCM10007854_21240 [Algimonas porphyrae]
MATAKTPTSKTKTTRAKRPSVTTETSDNVVPMNTEISQQLEILRTDLKTLAQTVKDQALSKVEGRKETVKTVATEQKDAAMARYDELSTKAETQIREKPLSSMAIAVGAGLVLGAILRG